MRGIKRCEAVDGRNMQTETADGGRSLNITNNGVGPIDDILSQILPASSACKKTDTYSVPFSLVFGLGYLYSPIKHDVALRLGSNITRAVLSQGPPRDAPNI